MILLLILHAFLIQAETRVYCQDSHAQPWKPLGYSCPVTCGNVLTAIRKLKSLDYSKLFAYKNMVHNMRLHDTNSRTDTIIKNTSEEHNEVNSDIKRSNNIASEETIKMYRRYYKILSDKDVETDLKTEIKRAMAIKACFLHDEILKLSKMCTEIRRSYVEDTFLKKFTAILNRYTNSVPFTEELTGMMLEKILGKNFDLRYGIFDVSKLVLFLRTTIQKYERNKQAHNGQVITLKSRHCLFLHVPGCFCKAGFVERSGQCVMPTDCFSGTIDNSILARIIVH